jgi:hypothetical protein
MAGAHILKTDKMFMLRENYGKRLAPILSAAALLFPLAASGFMCPGGPSPALSVDSTSVESGAPFTLSWTVPAGSINHYTISQTLNGATTTTSLPASTVSYTETRTAAKADKVFDYNVHACTSSDESACGGWSNTVAVDVAGSGGGCPRCRPSSSEPEQLASAQVASAQAAAGTKVVLNGDYTIATPSAAVFNGGVVLAWTGTNADHSVIVASSCDGLNFGAPQVFGTNTSFTGPGLTAFNGYLWLGWAGDNRINLATSTDGLNFGNQFLVGTEQTYNSYTSIALAGSSRNLYLAFAGVDEWHTLNIGSSLDGVNFGPPAVHGGIDLWDNPKDRTSLPFVAPSPPGSTLIDWNSNKGTQVNWSGVLDLIKQWLSPSPRISVDSPTLAFAPDGTLMWGAVILGSVEANAGNPYAFDLVEVNNRSLISNPGAVSTTGIGMATLGNTVYVAWVPSDANTVMIYGYEYGTWNLVSQMNTGESCAGNPTLLAFNGHLYMYWMGTNADNNLNAKLIL